jgi:Flp pilus assembly protein TadB
MSKQRQTARAERAAAEAAQKQSSRAERERAAARRARHERRRLLWRRMRLWQHGPGFSRRREGWGALGTLVLLVVIVVFVITRSVEAVLGTALIGLICAPLLVMIFVDRSRK